MNEDEKEKVHKRLAKYQKKLTKLLTAADELDLHVIRNTKSLIRTMRERILARTAEIQAKSQSGVEPQWGPYWYDKLVHAYNKVVEEIGDQFNQDLHRYCIKAYENGHNLAEDGLEFAAPGVQVKGIEFDPEELKISASFSADLITRMKMAQIKGISKEVALSLASKKGPGELIGRLAVDIDKGPWLAANYRAEVIARTETARIQELARRQRVVQLSKKFPDMEVYQQYLVAPILRWPCRQCSQYDGNVYDSKGQPFLIARGKTGGPMPDLPLHPNCRCTYIPWVSGLSVIPDEHVEEPHGTELVKVNFSEHHEGWVVKFHDSINTIRLPKNVDEETLKLEIGKLAKVKSLDPSTIDIQISWPRDLNKPSEIDEIDRHIHKVVPGLYGAGEKKTESIQDTQDKLYEMFISCVNTILEASNAAPGTRWHGVKASYHSWRGMKDRLNPANKDAHHYHGRGIKIDPRWLDYDNFVKDMGEPPHEGMTLDRIDNDGDYTKSNCRWATKKEQTDNRRYQKDKN
jgi:hypothetical protein